MPIYFEVTLANGEGRMTVNIKYLMGYQEEDDHSVTLYMEGMVVSTITPKSLIDQACGLNLN